MKNLAETILRSKENSSIFLISPNVLQVETEIAKMSTDIADEFVGILDTKGALRQGSMISETEFETLFKGVVEKYLGNNQSNK